MSVVTGITLHCKHDHECIREINNWLKERNFGPLERTDDHYGGNKHPQIGLYGAGYNYFYLDLEEEFMQYVLSRHWENRENTVLIINPEEDGCAVWRVS